MNAKFLAKYLILLALLFLFVISLIHFFPNNSFNNFSLDLITKHFQSSLTLSPIELLVYKLANIFYSAATLLDKVVPLFPSVLRAWWWSEGFLTLFILLPSILFAPLGLIKKRKLGVVLFILFFLWFIPLGTILSNNLNSFISEKKIDIYLPWFPKYVWMNEGNNSSQYSHYEYSWTQRSKTSGANILISCLGHYSLFVNGKRVYDGPDFSPLPNVYADSINVAPYIKTGSNSISVYCIFINGITHEYPNYPVPGFLAGGYIRDGVTPHNLADNRVWRYSKIIAIKPGEKLFDAGYSERYDLVGQEHFNKVPDEINIVYKVLSRPIDLLKYQKIEPKKLSEGVYDLGKFSTGYLSLRVNSKKSCKLTTTFGVSLDQNGSPNIYMHQEDFLLIPSSFVSWDQISRRSGRYIGISGNCDLTHVDITFSRVFNDLTMPKPPNGLSNLDKEIFEISKNSLINNVQDRFEDSVERERATYLGDSIPVSKCLLSEGNNQNLIKQTITEFAQSQNKDGSFPSMAASGANQLIPSYSLQWPYLLDIYLRATNDKEFAVKMWPHLELLLKWASNNSSKTGFFYNKSKNQNWWNFIDWTSTSQAFKYQSANQFWYLSSLEVASKVSRMIGENPKSYVDQTEKLRKQILGYAYDPNNHVFFDSFDEQSRDGISLTTNALAGYLNIFPDNSSSVTAVNYFSGDYFTISPFSEAWVVDWMIASGGKDLALQTIRGYWGGMVNAGATSVYEKYQPGVYLPNEENESYSHAWGCSPIYEYQALFRK